MLKVLLINSIAKPIWERRWLWALFLLLWLVEILLQGQPAFFNAYFLLFALVVFVVPHGSSDFFITAWILNPPWVKRWNYWAASFILAWLFAIVTLGLWSLSINFTIALFSAAMMWHWGSLDTIHIYPHRSTSWVIGSIGRGMLVVMSPLLFKPLETQDLLFTMLGIEESLILTTLYSFSKHLVLVGFLLEFVALGIHKFVEGQGVPAKYSGYMAETLILLLTFAWVSPLLAMTFYFLILHSFRHICRVPAYIPEARGSLIEGGGMLRNLSYHFQKTNFLTFIILLILCCWWAWKLYSGSSLLQASTQCIPPLFLFFIPHTLISLLADFNPKQLES